MPTPDIDIRRATGADRPEIIAVCQAALGWRDGDPNADFFAWKHDENAFGPSPMWVAVDPDGRILGVRTFMRWRFRNGSGDPVEAVRAVDTATRPDAQGMGIFSKLTLGALPDLRDDGIDVVFNTPNDKSRPGYLKMGWNVVGRVPVTARFAGPGAVRRVLGSRTGADKWSTPTDVGRPAAEALADPDAVGRLLARQPARKGIATDRTAAFVHWRYRFEPLRYRVLQLGTDLTEGAAVFRVRRRGPSLEVAVCDEWPGTAGRAALARAVAGLCREVGADYVLRVGRGPLGRGGFVRLPGAGPVLTWRSVRRPGTPAMADLDLVLGDVELF